MDSGGFWDQWMIVAWIAPAALAASAIIDVLLVGRRVFANAWQAAGISGALAVSPLLLAPLGVARETASALGADAGTIALAIAAGAAYVLHLLFYFQALFKANDAAHAETFLNLDVLAVPMLSFLLFDEQLRGAHYAGIALAGAGVAVLSLAARRRGRGAACTHLLTLAVLSIAASLVAEDQVFARCGYEVGVFWFAVGGLGASFACVAHAGRRDLARTLTGNKFALAALQATSVVALAANLRATDLSPSVALVVVIECATPALIMAFSALALALLVHTRGVRATALGALRGQLDDAPVKIGCLSLVLIGVMLVSQPL